MNLSLLWFLFFNCYKKKSKLIYTSYAGHPQVKRVDSRLTYLLNGLIQVDPNQLKPIIQNLNPLTPFSNHIEFRDNVKNYQ